MPADTLPQPAAEPAESHAVARCRAAWKQAYDAARAGGHDSYDSRVAAREAYFNAMPPLSSRENVCDFVACVARGILLDFIPPHQSTRLLYAAQVAITAQRKPAAPRKPSSPE